MSAEAVKDLVDALNKIPAWDPHPEDYSDIQVQSILEQLSKMFGSREAALAKIKDCCRRAEEVGEVGNRWLWLQRLSRAAGLVSPIRQAVFLLATLAAIVVLGVVMVGCGTTDDLPLTPQDYGMVAIADGQINEFCFDFYADINLNTPAAFRADFSNDCSSEWETLTTVPPDQAGMGADCSPYSILSCQFEGASPGGGAVGKCSNDLGQIGGENFTCYYDVWLNPLRQ